MMAVFMSKYIEKENLLVMSIEIQANRDKQMKPKNKEKYPKSITMWRFGYKFKNAHCFKTFEDYMK